MSATLQAEVFQSRWGYHSVGAGTYSKLRFLNGVYQKALSLAAAWERWDRKLPKNRVERRKIRDDERRVVAYGESVPLAEPEICPVFFDKVVRNVNLDRNGKFFKGGIPKTFVEDNGLGEKILAASRQARTPVASPEDVRPLRISVKEIDELYEQALEWVK
jgi:hypothetical protein